MKTIMNYPIITFFLISSLAILVFAADEKPGPSVEDTYTLDRIMIKETFGYERNTVVMWRYWWTYNRTQNINDWQLANLSANAGAREIDAAVNAETHRKIQGQINTEKKRDKPTRSNERDVPVDSDTGTAPNDEPL